MSDNSFGRLFRVTTWGESHGPAIGCVIDGCPPGIEISEEEIRAELVRRATGRSRHTSQRKEKDALRILSGWFEGRTTGTPNASAWNCISKLLAEAPPSTRNSVRVMPESASMALRTSLDW